MINYLKSSNLYFLPMVLLVSMVMVISSCGDDEPDPIDPPDAPLPTSSFDTGTIDGLTVTFVNASINASSQTWDFGDGNTSTEANPTHTYEMDGTYTVTLTVTNSDGATDVTTREVTVMEPVFGNFITGKAWQMARENSIAYHLGPQDDSWTYGQSGPAPWFSVGDFESDGVVDLLVRESVANDVYTFNSDGSYNIDFNGDFWGEFGIWAGTEFNEVNITIAGDALPLRADGVDVSAFVNTTQNYVIDEANATLQVVGEGAHILNPRYKNENSSHEVGNGITYDIFRIAEGPTADTLVLTLETFDNDFNAANRNYWTLIDYRGNVPDLVVAETPSFVPVDLAPEISACEMSHGFDADGSIGTGVDEITSSSTVEYGVEMAGVTATRYTRTDADGGFTDFKLWSRDSDIRFDDGGTYTCAKAVMDIFIPSSNAFAENGLQNQVEVILADESGDDDGGEGGPGFWCCWQIESITDIPLDTWTTLEFDFTGDLDDENAASGVRDDIDLIIIRPGGSGHGDSGEFYMSNFRIENVN